MTPVIKKSKWCFAEIGKESVWMLHVRFRQKMHEVRKKKLDDVYNKLKFVKAKETKIKKKKTKTKKRNIGRGWELKWGKW